MSKRRGRAIRILIALLCVGGLGWLVHSLGPRQVLRAALAADPWWLALSVVGVFGRFLIWGHKWTRMLRREAPVPYPLATRILIAGTFVNQITPTAKLAGGFVRAALLHRRRGWELSTAYGWAMADQVTNLLGHLVLIGGFSLWAGSLAEVGERRSTFLVVGALALAGVVVAVALRGHAWKLSERSGIGGRLVALVPRRFRVAASAEQANAVAQRVLGPLLREGHALRTFLPDMLWAAAAFGVFCLGGALVLKAVGSDVSLFAAAVAVVLGYVAGVAVGWGGIGVTEAALVGLFVQIGVPPEQAAAGALLHRATFYVVVLIWGGLSLWWEGRAAPYSATSSSTPV